MAITGADVEEPNHLITGVAPQRLNDMWVSGVATRAPDTAKAEGVRRQLRCMERCRHRVALLVAGNFFMIHGVQ